MAPRTHGDRTAWLQVRMLPAELDEFKRLAALEHLSVSELVRIAVLSGRGAHRAAQATADQIDAEKATASPAKPPPTGRRRGAESLLTQR